MEIYLDNNNEDLSNKLQKTIIEQENRAESEPIIQYYAFMNIKFKVEDTPHTLLMEQLVDNCNSKLCSLMQNNQLFNGYKLTIIYVFTIHLNCCIV